jgi:predicted lysophospholipase L1 biosynthesis ABC-type transport system permease subunit
MELEWVFLPWILVGTIAAGMAITLLLGLSGVRSALAQKPGPILRNE